MKGLVVAGNTTLVRSSVSAMRVLITIFRKDAPVIGPSSVTTARHLVLRDGVGCGLD